MPSHNARRTILAAVAAVLLNVAAAHAGVQDQRLDFINRLIGIGVFSKLEKPASLCHLWTGHQFAGLAYDDKSKFVNVVYAYCITADSRANIVVIKDGRTGKRIGSYSSNTGLRLD